MISQYLGFDSDYIIIGLSAVVLILLILIIVNIAQMRKLKKAYKVFMSGKNGKNLEDTLIKRLDQVDTLLEANNENEKTIKSLFEAMQLTYQKMGLIKYDAVSYTHLDVYKRQVYVMKRILETVIKYGARSAEPGEFTKRAFLNGRIDLSQAESVIDVISAKNEFALKSSMKQLSGAVSDAVKEIRGEILHAVSYTHLDVYKRQALDL